MHDASGGNNAITSTGPLDDEGSFEDGSPGSECNKPLTSAISVQSDPDYHEFTLNQTSVTGLVLEFSMGSERLEKATLCGIDTAVVNDGTEPPSRDSLN